MAGPASKLPHRHFWDYSNNPLMVPYKSDPNRPQGHRLTYVSMMMFLKDAPQNIIDIFNGEWLQVSKGYTGPPAPIMPPSTITWDMVGEVEWSQTAAVTWDEV